MFHSMQAKVFLSTVLLIGITACSSSKQTEGTPQTGSAPNAEKNAPGTSTNGSSNSGNVPAAAFNIPKLIGKMSWESGLFNNKSGKVFTGFDGTNVFKVLVDVGVLGNLPETIQLSEEQAEKLYTSAEYQAAIKAEVGKISLEADPAFLSVKMLEEYPEGRLYELTTVKAGTTTPKAASR